MGRVVAFPFVVIWALIRGILNVTGRLVSILLGIVLVTVGVALCLTVIGAIVGIPLIVIGAALILKGIFG
jgi:hypothetical protein